MYIENKIQIQINSEYFQKFRKSLTSLPATLASRKILGQLNDDGKQEVVVEKIISFKEETGGLAKKSARKQSAKMVESKNQDQEESSNQKKKKKESCSKKPTETKSKESCQ